MFYRRGILIRTIAIVLACSMPLCCCFVSAVAGGSSSCCGVSDTASCCAEPSVDWLDDLLGPVQQEETPDSCDGACCIKAYAHSQNWTPPVDTIGQDLPSFLLQDVIVDAYLLSTSSITLHPPPLIEISQLGFSGAPPIRGSLILQV